MRPGPDNPPEWDNEPDGVERERLAALTEPGDPDLRMNAYYYSFERTGVGIVDAILSAVASAGKAYHSTENWGDEDQWTSPSHEQRIQDAANAAAERIREACR